MTLRLKDGLRLVQRMQELERQLAEAELDRQLLADKVVEFESFTDWLLEQDVSSSVMQCGRTLKQGVPVEGASNVTLALAWARRIEDNNWRLQS